MRHKTQLVKELVNSDERDRRVEQGVGIGRFHFNKYSSILLLFYYFFLISV